MTQSGMWRNEPMSVDFSSFMSSLTRTFSFHQSSPRDIGQNLAVFSREYANISLRLGYHFNMIDAYMCQNPNDNYAYFRFFGASPMPAEDPAGLLFWPRYWNGATSGWNIKEIWW